MGGWFIKVSVIYFSIGVIWGLFMGITQDFSFTTAHAHINLLGWVSLALAGLIYLRYPGAGDHLLAKLHFWIHNLGLICFVIGLGIVVKDYENPIANALIPIGGTVAVIAVLIFTVNVWVNAKRSVNQGV